MRRQIAALAVLIGSVASAACSSSSTTSTSTGPAGPPGIAVVALHPSGGPVWKPGDSGCVELGRDPGETVGVEVKLDNWTLRPPYTCGATPQCGYVRVRVDPTGDNGGALSAQAAASLVPLPFASLPNAIGTHTLRVELRNDQNALVIDKTTGKPYAVDLQVTLGAPGTCGGAPLDAGSDADSGTDAGDAATEAGDAAPETATEAGDAASDSGDAGDAASDAATDSGDAGSEAATDAGGDASAGDAGDASSDGDAGDAGDASSDAASDATSG